MWPILLGIEPPCYHAMSYRFDRRQVTALRKATPRPALGSALWHVVVKDIEQS